MDTPGVPLQHLDRALEILELFIDTDDIGVREVARRTGWNATTCHRVLTTFAQRGYLLQDGDTRRYRIGPRIDELASRKPRAAFQEEAANQMRHLRDQTRESIGLHSAVGGWRVCTFQVESNQELRWTTTVGRPIPVLWGASDRVFRAFCDDAQVALFDEVVAELEQNGEYVPRPGENRDVESVRRAGWAATACAETRTPGAAAVAAPVFRNGEVFVLTVVGPEVRLREVSAIESVVPELLRAAVALSDSWHASGEHAQARDVEQLQE